MTAKNRTSNKRKKPGVYIDASKADTATSRAAQARARKFQAIRSGSGSGAAASGSAASASAALANSALQQAKAAQEANAAAIAAVAAAAAASSSAASASHSAAAAAATDADADDNDDGEAEDQATGPAGFVGSLSGDGMSVSLTPFVSSDSASISVASSTDSSLKDERLLGVALWEWLLPKTDFDCHTLWEAFLRDWDLITETERPPGTNRPTNLHGYLTYLRAPNNKTVVRQDIRTVRERIEKERQDYLAAHPDDPRAILNLRAATQGSLLSYALKVKNLIPYESQSQKRRQEAKKRKLMQQQQQQQQQQEEEQDGGEAQAGAQAEAAESEQAAADAVVEAKQQQLQPSPPQQPNRKKGKHTHTKGAPPPPELLAAAAAAAAAAPSLAAAAAAGGGGGGGGGGGQAKRGPRVRPPPAEKLGLGKPSSFAALLDCD
jgi:hypothetical protein